MKKQQERRSGRKWRVALVAAALGWRKFAGSVTGMLLSFFLLGYGMMWLGRLVGTPLA